MLIAPGGAEWCVVPVLLVPSNHYITTCPYPSHPIHPSLHPTSLLPLHSHPSHPTLTPPTPPSPLPSVPILSNPSLLPSSWHLMQVLQSIGMDAFLPDHPAERIHLSYAAQLEGEGLWQWALFVLLHMTDDERYVFAATCGEWGQGAPITKRLLCNLY